MDAEKPCEKCPIDCGKKHLALAGILLSVVIVVTLALSNFVVSSSKEDLGRAREERQSIELRVRAIENDMAAIRVQLEFIRRDIIGIDAKIGTHRQETPNDPERKKQ